MAQCSYQDCETKLYARGWCIKHYTRWQRYGSPETVRLVKYTSPEEAFAARTKRDDNGCLIWTGSKNPNGYGQMRVKGKLTQVHRWAYEKANGAIPDGLVIDHVCYTIACSNVEHLQAVTPKQNSENPSGLSKNNTSGYANVYWNKRGQKWKMGVMHGRRYIGGGSYPPYELHVAAFRARLLRNELHTNNLQDKV